MPKKGKSKRPKKAGTKTAKNGNRLFKGLLLKERMNILEGLSTITRETLKKSQREASGDLSGYSYHMADMASDVSERDLLLQLASGEREMLMKIDEALSRMKEGKYGVCAGCRKKISRARLRAIPHTSYCRDCQEKEEKKP